MRVGISFGPSVDAFRLGEVLRTAGYDVTFVALGKELWFDGMLDEKQHWNVVPVREVATPFDVFIDTFGHMNVGLRSQLGRKVVMYLTEDMSFTLRESIVYEKDKRVFNYDGIDCIWTIHEKDVDLLKTLSKKAVKVVPFYWSPLDMSGSAAGLHDEVHIMGSGRIQESIVPSIQIAKKFVGATKIYIDAVDTEAEYFKNNIWDGLDNRFIFKAPLHESAVVLTHERFASGKPQPAVLDCVWRGQAVIHNCEWLRAFGHGYDRLYYDSYEEAAAIYKMVSAGLWKSDANMKDIIGAFTNTDGWGGVLDTWSAAATAHVPVRPRRFVIQFSDFWADFNPEYNFFTLLFTEALHAVADNRRVVGVGEHFEGRADLVVCGPYSERWRGLDPEIPKICFTGELSQPVYGDGIFLNVGFLANGYKFIESGVNYCRFPLWAASINWFGADNNRLVNPTLIDIDECLVTHDGTSRREKFCAFVVSNPSNAVRNEAFNTLNTYKPVDSAGALFNNMGSGLFAGLGGGGGERRKVEFFKDYRFALVYENSSWPGYTTEKLFHAKVAGCLPLYWGDATANTDFDERGFVNLTHREGSLLSAVQWLEEHPEELDRMAALPALTEAKMDELRSVMALLAKFTLERVFPGEGELWSQLPTELGARSSTEAAAFAERRCEEKPLEVTPVTTPEFNNKLKEMRFVVEASEVDAGDLYLWLSYINSTELSKTAEIILLWKGATHSQRLVAMKKSYSWLRIVTELAEKSGFTCYLSPRTVPVGNPYYMCCVAEKYGSCCLKYKDRLVECGSSAPMDELRIDNGSHVNSQRIFADNFVGFDTLEGAREAGKAFYCWSGKSFKFKHDFLPRVSECSLINLKRRPDRLARFAKTHAQETIDNIKIVDAVDGRELKMTPHIKRLFEGGMFGWKKGVIGCNLSHLKIWYGLAHSNQFVENMLILEDDVRFMEGWEDRLVEAMKVAPVDFDVLYLGGLLPPNKTHWQNVREPVNKFWDRAIEYCHFCAYAYILSKRGAEKLLEGIKRDGGYKRVSDHQILGSNMNVYIMNPMIASCFQEDDPLYVNANFDSKGEQKYDSDLWTSSDCFAVDGVGSASLDIEKVIEDVNACQKAAAAAVTVATPEAAVSPRVLFLTENAVGTYEKEWLADIMEMPADCWKKAIVLTNENLNRTVAEEGTHLLVVYRQTTEEEISRFMDLLEEARAVGKRVIVIHLSDEYMANDISFYEDPCVSFVIRNYIRPLTPAIRSKVLTLPLGYYRKAMGPVPALSERKLLWSFHGTSWFNRLAMIDTLAEQTPHSLRVKETWDDAGSSSEEYLGDLLNSVVIPCPRGNNEESFRIYEALEAGAMPFLVDSDGGPFYRWIQSALPSIVISRSYEGCIRLLTAWKEKPQEIIERHATLMAEWARWKTHLHSVIRQKVFWA